ncbi:LacI family DNA-binding transcriptional regulator [Bifidobacterium gallicum]|nr:LacI family DNA-binding transcriptional regulator [Bifidobacterium gallicum]KFI59613.1 LacI family transcription regulator [Bifidobacterium gallicum DSM 20093 = LMG 11596]
MDITPLAKPPAAQSKPLLSDIARTTGFSLATVSKVLNGRADVSSQTRQIITQALNDAGYSKHGRSKTSSSTLIEVVFQDFKTVWALEVLRGVVHECSQHNLSVVTSEIGHGPTSITDWIDRVAQRGIMGAILVFSELSQTEERKLQFHHIPYVIFDPSGDPKPTKLCVQADNWTGGLLATRHLLTLGHRRIGIITGPDDMLCSRARLDGYTTALAEEGILIDPALITEGDFTTPGGYAQAMELLLNPERPTAIFAGSDLQAMGVYEAARQCGLRIPDDLSVVGFDDVQTAAFLGPPLTTVRQPLQDMAVEATRMIIETNKDSTFQKQVILPTTLVVRNSTAAPPQPE